MILALLQQVVRLANARRDETWGIPLPPRIFGIFELARNSP